MPSKPNIIMSLVDDMGWQDTSEPFLMERLARSGVKVTQAYAWVDRYDCLGRLR